MKKRTTNHKNVHIRLLDHMELIVGDRYTKEPFEKSQRSRALTALLILKRGESVTFAELGNALWKDRPNQNAANAIKVLVCRIRSQLSEIDPALHNCFVARSGSYAWNMDITASVDVFMIEDLCRALVTSYMNREEQYERLVEILGMYTRRLLPELAGEPWVIEYAEHLHGQVFGAADHVIDRLSEEEDWERVAKLCGLCVEAMPNDTCWQEKRMSVLMTLDRRNEAMQQYMQSVNMKRAKTGPWPASNIFELYDQVSKSDPPLASDLEIVGEELLSHDDMGGALFCDYAVFREVYALQRRSMDRSDQMTYLAIVRISNEMDPSIHILAMEEVMQRLARILQGGLRRGDTIARYTPTQYVILLQGTKHEAVTRVLERVRLAFYDELKHVRIRLEFDYRLLIADGRKRRVSQHSTNNNGYAAHVLPGKVSRKVLDDR